MARKLKRLRVKRIDLVEQGASFDPVSGTGSKVVLFKSADPTVAKPLVAQVGTQRYKPVAPGSGIRPHPDAPNAEATRQEIGAFIEMCAGEEGISLEEFLATPEGAELYRRYLAAPLMREEPTSSPGVEPALDLTTLRDAAKAEEQAGELTRAAYQKMLDRAEALYPWERSIAKRLSMLSERSEFRSLYQNYSAGTRAQTCKAREAFVNALIADELEALVQKLGEDPAVKSRAEAVALVQKAAPGFHKVCAELLEAAREGAPVAALEKGSDGRRAVVRKLVGAVDREVKRHESAPERVTITKAVAMVLDDHVGLAAAMTTGDATAVERWPWLRSEVESSVEKYREYRDAVLSAFGDGPEAA